MRSVVHSKAFGQFEESLGMAGELLDIEQRLYHSPPHLKEQQGVRGLRGAVAVLIVAAFEGFLRQLMEEHLWELGSRHLQLSFQKLPDKIRVNNIYNSLERAMRGPLFQDPPPKVQRLVDIERACKIVIAGTVNPEAFCDTGGNPNSRNRRTMFSNINLSDITATVKSQFDRKWGKPTAQTFINDKLDEIVNRRHVVAHTADALNISRGDLRESIKFLRTLAQVIDLELGKYVKDLIKICT
jgi:hypothetical protein